MFAAGKQVWYMWLVLFAFAFLSNGQDLGVSTRNGLALTANDPSTVKKRQLAANSTVSGNGVDAAEILESFAKGLGESFHTGRNLSKLGLMGGTNFTSMVDTQSMLRPLAAGAGAGVGMGIAVGLNLKSADAQPTLGGNITGTDVLIALVAEGFVQNMLSNLLMNSSALQQAGTFFAANQPQIFADADPAKVAEGFARGAIEGMMSAMSSAGGLKNLISGNLSTNALENVPVLEPSKFDDSVNGSATGFARGLTGPGTILVAEAIRNLTKNMQTTATTDSMRRRAEADIGVAVPRMSLSTRQNQEVPAALPRFPVAIDAPRLQMFAQKAVDTVTCQGIGGLASVGLGTMTAAKAKAAMSGMALSGVPLNPVVFQSLPNRPIALTSEGNSFNIVIKKASVEINGLKLVPFAVLTGLHVLFAGMAFLTFLPLYLIFGVVWRFSVLAGHPVDEFSNRKWRMGFLITFAILGFTGITLGIVGMGDARHFRETHGVIGLISLILMLPAVGFSCIRLRTTETHPSPASFAGIRGPIALSKTPQRIYLISGILTQLVLALGQFGFIQGFSTLRSISLCIVDAVLTSNIVAGLMSFVLMIQISATALIGIRAWLEQHIAKREAAGEKLMALESGRKSSIQAFVFHRNDPSQALDLSFRDEKSEFVQDKTKELRGFEGIRIGTPFNVRKDGSIVSPLELEHDRTVNRRTYNPKTGAYDSDLENNIDFYTVPVSYVSSNNPTPTRQEPDLFNGPKAVGVSTRDLWPPLAPP